MSAIITHFFVFCYTCSQFFYCTNSIENLNKKDKYSRNSLQVNMVGEDMESLLIIVTIGKLVQNLHQPEHNLLMDDNTNWQDAGHSEYVMTYFWNFMQEPVFWLFIEGSKQNMAEQKGDKNTNSRNNGTVKTDSSRIEGIHFMPKIAPKYSPFM